jgi:aminoglycoside phosphotransferase family enzyme/predicted kinase
MEQRILKSLLKRSAYPEPVTSVRLIQTHVSFIFITDKLVYKIKKPVNFGFLNFTTLDRRRFYCNEEVRLNRRLCPDMYLGVVELRRTHSGATFSGEGEVLDYAVKMRRLPEERMLDRLFREDRVTVEDIRRIACTIGEFHLNAEHNEKIDSFASPDSITRNWEENFQQIDEFCAETVKDRDLRIIRQWVENFLADRQRLFAERISRGFIKDCDGDIHMENICLTDQVLIFDCIEFNDRFRFSDTAADIAFLLMDFDFQGHSDFSEAFLAEYIAVTGDHGIRPVLDFYKIYRAVVRGKVESLRLHDPNIPEIDKLAAKERAISYFRLARGYIIRGKLPLTLFITCGLMGSGKSTIASRLAVELGIGSLSSDQVRKELSSVPRYSHKFSDYGTGIYGEKLTEATYRKLLDEAETSISAGRSVMVDATFQRKKDRIRFRSAAEKHAACFRIIMTTSSEKVVKKRLDARQANLREVSDGRWELYQRQRDAFDPVGLDEQLQIYLDTSLPLHDTIDMVLDQIGIL